MTDEGMAELRRVYPWAADEIERLRRASANDVYALGDRQRKVDRLRAALERIVALDPNCQLYDTTEIIGVARAALAGTAETGSEPRRIGPDMPDNDMVICPHCTSQFGAIPVNVQARLRAAERLLRDVIDTDDGRSYWKGIVREARAWIDGEPRAAVPADDALCNCAEVSEGVFMCERGYRVARCRVAVQPPAPRMEPPQLCTVCDARLGPSDDRINMLCREHARAANTTEAQR